MITRVRSGVAFLLLTYCTIEGDTHFHAFIQVYAFIFHLQSCRQTVKVTLLLPSQHFKIHLQMVKLKQTDVFYLQIKERCYR